jgi:hypothetical protein
MRRHSRLSEDGVKARMLIDYEFPIYTNGVDCRDGWTTGQGKAGDIKDAPDCWKLCCIRDHGPHSSTFARVYAEPADDECRAACDAFCKQQTGQTWDQWLTTDRETGRPAEEFFRERFGAPAEETSEVEV